MTPDAVVRIFEDADRHASHVWIKLYGNDVPLEGRPLGGYDGRLFVLCGRQMHTIDAELIEEIAEVPSRL